jgi:transposase
LCNAHLLRELIGIIENTKQEWAAKMIGLFLEMKNVVDLHKEKGDENISAYYAQYFGLEYDKIVEEGLKINPFAAKETGKRGAAKQSKARRLLERLRDHKTEYLLFTQDFKVPFDNNQAERDFRISKTKQKVSGCFRSDTGTESFAVIQSIIQTLRKHKINIFDELYQSFTGSYSLPLEVAATE